MAILNEAGLQRYTYKVKEYIAEHIGKIDPLLLVLRQQVSDLQTQVNTLLGYYNELENIIG